MQLCIVHEEYIKNAPIYRSDTDKQIVAKSAKKPTALQKQ